MGEVRPIFEYHEESQSEKLARKSRESPFMIIGIASFLSAVGYGIYRYRNRGTVSTSVFMMQFRVISQGAAVAALTAGMAYTMYNKYIRKPITTPVETSTAPH